LLVAALTVALAGCGSTSSASRAPSTVASRAEAVGDNPSQSAKMVCEAEAQSEIADSIGVTPTQVTTPTWIDRVYACNYVYPGGVISLSVKELGDASATTSYFDELGSRLGHRPDPPALGDGAFVATDGSVVVRKDYKVLDVDISHLPAQFGDPLQDRSDVAVSVATTVMGCWVGA
jgi:hypothetical protein